MNITYKPMSSMCLEDAHRLFNRGFEGYLIPMNISLDAFVARFGKYGLSPALSVVAYDGMEPIGFVLQGIREANGQNISWNGGTGIIPEYRGRTLGQRLMQEAERLLTEQHVNVATLESLSENTVAVALYERCGYQVNDHLLFLEADGPLEDSLPSLDAYELKRIPAAQAVGSTLFPSIVPWQTDASHIPGGEAVIILQDDDVQAACLIQKNRIFGKKTDSITLFQVNENGNETALHRLLAHALEYDQPIRRTTYNFSQGNGQVVSSLQTSGFKKTSLSQVFMTKKL